MCITIPENGRFGECCLSIWLPGMAGRRLKRTNARPDTGSGAKPDRPGMSCSVMICMLQTHILRLFQACGCACLPSLAHFFFPRLRAAASTHPVSARIRCARPPGCAGLCPRQPPDRSPGQASSRERGLFGRCFLPPPQSGDCPQNIKNPRRYNSKNKNTMTSDASGSRSPASGPTAAAGCPCQSGSRLHFCD